jgi:hypothetical protein
MVTSRRGRGWSVTCSTFGRFTTGTRVLCPSIAPLDPPQAASLQPGHPAGERRAVQAGGQPRGPAGLKLGSETPLAGLAAPLRGPSRPGR